MNFNQNMPRYRIIQRASTLWTSFRGGILGCQKGVAFHAPLQHGSRRRFQFEIPLKTYRDGLCCACDRRQISMTPRILYTVVLRTFVIPPSTVVSLTKVESGSRRSACGFRPQLSNWKSSSMDQDMLCSLMGLPYETLCQTVRTGNGLNWSEVT